MIYRVTFMERTNAAGEPTESPSEFADIDFADGVVLSKTFVERTQPSAMHGAESLDEDDSFLSVGSETWDYQVANGRKDEFLAGVQNSRMAMDCVAVGDEN